VERGAEFGKVYNFTIRPRRETLDETMTPVQLAGAALVLGGVVLVTLRPAR